MNKEDCKLYKLGNSDGNYLSIWKTRYIQSEVLQDGSIREIECDIEEKWMKVRTRRENSLDWFEIDLSELNDGTVMNMNENGDRWKGSSLKGNPFGYGCIYNSENQLKYTGFMFEGMKVCYGIEMYEDVGIVEYEGGYYVNARCGYGKLYTNDNKLKYEGEWKDGNWNGKGVEYYENGVKGYEGEWKDGNYHGSGVLYYENGNI